MGELLDEVKFGGGTFDLATILKDDGVTLKANSSVGAAKSRKAMINKLKRDHFAFVNKRFQTLTNSTI